MIVPGTTISLTLMPTYIEVRDKGVIKKKIPLKARSFDDISLELQKYFKYLGKRLAPGTLDDILVRIGLPKARRILHEADEKIATEGITVEISRAEVPIEEHQTEPELQPQKRDKKRGKREKIEPILQSASNKTEVKGVVSSKDFDDIADALEAVEALSDSFMTGIKEMPKEEKQPEITLNIEGQDEIVASGSTYIRAPKPTSQVAEEIAPISNPDFDEIVAETVSEEIPLKTVKETPLPSIPSHQIKPIKECKALLLGETGVGKRSLKAKAGIAPLVINEEKRELSSYIYNKVIDGLSNRISLNIWSFDLAVKSKLPRKEFYSDAQVIIIVYAASDRWSFESIDFWLREASISCENNLPIVIVGNKVDLRLESKDDTGDEPVSYEEGFQFAEELAKKLSTKKELHPVAFIETSCLTGEGTESVFKTAAELFENSLLKQMK